MEQEILYRPYSDEVDLPDIMALVQSELSEPYVIYTYRYFLHQWPHLAYMAHTTSSRKPIGVVVSKQDVHRGKANRGYIAMLSVSREWRKRGIASQLVRLSIASMKRHGADEVTLETEYDNSAALSLYASMGFIREKRLYRFYMSGKDAFRLVLPFQTSKSSAHDTISRWSTTTTIPEQDEGSPYRGAGGRSMFDPYGQRDSTDDDEDLGEGSSGGRMVTNYQAALAVAVSSLTSVAPPPLPPRPEHSSGRLFGTGGPTYVM